jgi:hypothetical protein
MSTSVHITNRNQSTRSIGHDKNLNWIRNPECLKKNVAFRRTILGQLPGYTSRDPVISMQHSFSDLPKPGATAEE